MYQTPPIMPFKNLSHKSNFQMCLRHAYDGVCLKETRCICFVRLGRTVHVHEHQGYMSIKNKNPKFEKKKLITHFDANQSRDIIFFEYY